MISEAFRDSSMPGTIDKVLLCVLALFVPPLPIYLLTFPRSKLNTREFWISLLFTFLFFAGGVLYTFYFILVLFPDARLQNAYFGQGDEESRPAVSNCNHCGENINQSSNIEQPAASASTSASASAPAHSEAESEPLLPSYTDVTGIDEHSPAPQDSKVSDNKVQK